MAANDGLRGAAAGPNAILLMTLAIAAQVTVSIDFSLASVAMPSIEKALGISPAVSQWILTADLLAYAGFLIVGGRLGDIFGQRAALIAGLLLYLFGSLATSLVDGVGLLFTARTVQGMGGALIYPSAFSILTITFPAGEQRFKAYTINMASQAVGVPILTILAGWGITLFGWRSSFLLNVPLCIAVLGMIALAGPLQRTVAKGGPRVPLGNAALMTGAMASFVYALSAFVAKDPAMRAHGPYALAAAAVIFLIFVLVERRSASPLIPPALLRTRSFAGGLAIVATMVLAGKAIVVLSNISFQKALHFTPLQASFMLIPMGVASLLLIPLTRVTGQFLLPYPKATLTGAFVTLGAYYLLLSVTPGTSAVVMLTLVMFLAPLSSVTGANMALSETLKAVPSAEQGVATAMVYTCVQMFSAVGMATFIAASGRSTAEDIFARFSPSYEIGVILAIVGIGLTVLLLPGPLLPPRRKVAVATNAQETK